jgi:aryl-alcohol dehydrogenase-like predicted oxidoreductase|nr:aldo/keto reductase [uncultured Lachnoclostridium sp.]
MKQVVIPNTDLSVSNICLGAGNFGDKLNEEEAHQILDQYVHSGGNFIDTANVYCRWATGDNSSEQYLGRWLKSRNTYQNVLIATKGAHYYLGDKEKTSRVNKKEVAIDLEESLLTLGLDSIGLYYLHRDDKQKPVEEIIDFCEEFVKEGKIRYYAFSNWDLDRAERALNYAKSSGKKGFIALSNQYSLAYMEKENSMNQDETLSSTDMEYLEWHKKTKIPLIPYTSVANGFYEKLQKSDAYHDGILHQELLNETMPEKMIRSYINPCNLKRYEILKELQKEFAYTMVELSLAYLTNHTAPIIPVVSVRSSSQLEQVVRSSEIILPSDVITRLDECIKLSK